MATASAPAKVYLFGEHAVVYGEPAVPCAITRRASVTVDERRSGLRVNAPDLSIDGFTITADGSAGSDPLGGSTDPPVVDVPADRAVAAIDYVAGAIEQARDAADAPDAGFEVTIDSDIPLGAGLGSSAAVVVATIDAATRALGLALDPAEVADRAYLVEYAVQDGQASRADTFCSATGGAVRVEDEDCRPIDAPDLPFAIGYDGGSGDTAQLVASVRALREEYDFAADTVGAIGDVVRAGEGYLVEDPDDALGELGRLMNFNHGLLTALGVSSRSLDAMAWTAREAGAPGAKLTGAGGGGCVVALDPTGAARQALRIAPPCMEAFEASLDREGVRRE